MTRGQRMTVLALCCLLAACATPQSAPVRTIEVTPSSALDADLQRLDELVLRRDFVTVPTRRDRAQTVTGPVDVLRSYEFRNRRTLQLSIGWELQHSRYRIFVTDFGRAPTARGLECRKYLEIFEDVTKVFGPARVVASDDRCDPLADGG